MTDALQDLTLGKVMSCDGTLLRGGITRLCCAVLAAALCRFQECCPVCTPLRIVFGIFPTWNPYSPQRLWGNGTFPVFLLVGETKESVDFISTADCDGLHARLQLYRETSPVSTFRSTFPTEASTINQAVPHFRPPLSNEAGSEAFVASAMGKPLILPLAS